MTEPETIDPKEAFIVGSYYNGRIELCAYEVPRDWQAELALLLGAPKPHVLASHVLSQQGAKLERLPEPMRSLRGGLEEAERMAEQRGAQLVYCFWRPERRAKETGVK